jgi:FMN phosphatase YigB (HAD superfamily)
MSTAAPRGQRCANLTHERGEVLTDGEGAGATARAERSRPEPMTVLLFDFFGTLVDYDPSRTAQGYPQTHSLLRELGAELAYADFLERWSTTASRFDAASEADDHEFSMLDLSRGYLADIGVSAADEDVARLAIYETALLALDATAADCTFVGDTRSPDYDGPRAVGMRALLIDPHDVHPDLGCDERIRSILDLPDRR